MSYLSTFQQACGVPPFPQLPITITILPGFWSLLNIYNNFHGSFWAICLTAFLFFFRGLICFQTCWVNFNGRSISHMSLFRCLLPKLGVHPALYGSHSFWWGGASFTLWIGCYLWCDLHHGWLEIRSHVPVPSHA